MRVFTLWHEDDSNEIPWIVNAVDEYTINNNCEFPPAYLKHRADIHVREMIIDIPEDAVRALFSSPSVKATVVQDDQKIKALDALGAPDGAAEHGQTSAPEAPEALLHTVREFSSGNARERDVAAAAYRLAAAKLRAWGVESHAKDLERAAEQVEQGLASEWIEGIQ